jgi:hypothetical protein
MRAMESEGLSTSMAEWVTIYARDKDVKRRMIWRYSGIPEGSKGINTASVDGNVRKRKSEKNRTERNITNRAFLCLAGI